MTGERAGWHRDPVADPTDDLADEDEDLDEVAGDRTAVHAEVTAVRMRDSAGDAGSADSGETVALPPTPERVRPPGATTVLPPHIGPDPGRFARRDLHDEPTQVVPLPFGGPLDPPPRAPGRPPAPEAGGAGPFDFVGERPTADRRRRTVGALLAVLALLLVAVIAGVLLFNGLGRDGGSGGTAAGPSVPPTVAAVPAGYRLYRGEEFTVGVPTGWTVEQESPGVVDLNEPGDTGRFLRLIAVGSARPALEQLTSAERSFAANEAYAPYRKLRLASVDYRGYDAAEWEFTFGGSQRHVLYRGAVVGGRTYGLYLSVPADRWQESRRVFQTAADTFRPTPR
jgi:eukaryotic-like serine/threonine-protein kinase